MSEYIIKVPNLTAKKTIDFCNRNFDFRGRESVTYDFGSMGTFEPFGMLMLGSKIRYLTNKHPNITFNDRNYQHHEYAAHMGFFQSVYQKYGKMPGEARGSNRYIPVTHLDVKDLRIESYEETEEVQYTIQRKAGELSQVLSQGNLALQEILTYSIRELMRNIVEHSDSDAIWFAAQAWESKDIVEIAILDEGVGVHQAISFNPNLDLDSHKEALMVAIEPGISGKAFKHKGKERKQRGSIWDNSGYGLYVTSEICQLGGNFILCSGDCALAISDNKFSVRRTNFKGTSVRMRMKISSIKKFGHELIENIVEKGESKAAQNTETANIRASKVSRLWKT